jgi:hypothetical protein
MADHILITFVKKYSGILTAVFPDRQVSVHLSVVPKSLFKWTSNLATTYAPCSTSWLFISMNSKVWYCYLLRTVAGKSAIVIDAILGFLQSVHINSGIINRNAVEQILTIQHCSLIFHYTQCYQARKMFPNCSPQILGVPNSKIMCLKTQILILNYLIILLKYKFHICF